MNLLDAIQYALEGKAILFAGSGFSYGAENYNHEPLKNGAQLRDCLALTCGIEKTNSSLSSVADYYLRLDGHSTDTLISFLLDKFTLGTISESHKTVMSLRWKRAYTTNYDLVIEEGAKYNGRILSSVTLDDSIDAYPKESVCVHINGSISHLTKEMFNTSFKLTDSSYDSDTLIGKPWFDFMERDFISAKAIIVIGFSMQYDIDIRRILARPQIAAKTVFITGPEIDPIDKSTLEKYAPVETIGIDGFAEEVAEKMKTYTDGTLVNRGYTSFLHEHMTPKEKKPVHFEDLTSFYYLGHIGETVLQKDEVGDYPYVALRDATNTFLRERFQYKVFLAVSTLGNGKTLLCKLIQNELREVDTDVFVFQKETVDTREEIEVICREYAEKPIVIIIDDYYKYLNMLKCFGDFGHFSKVTFLLTSRMSKVAANYRRLMNILRVDESQIRSLRLNTLTHQEVDRLANVLYENKMLSNEVSSGSVAEVSNFIETECRASISNVITRLFDSSYIKNQLTQLYVGATSTETSRDIQRLAIAALASEVMNLRLSTDDIVGLLKIDFAVLRFSESELIGELFDAESEEIKVRSPIIARKILQDIIPLESLLEVLNDLLFSANALYNNSNNYGELMKAIVSHANFSYWITQEGHIQALKNFYDNLRMLSFFTFRNPFYWEQFASICIDAKDFPTAQQCLNNAFEEAGKIEHFIPFQVETVYARFEVSRFEYSLNQGIETTQNLVACLLDATAHLIKYYSHPENDHYLVFRLFNRMVAMVTANMSALDNRDTSMFLEKMIDMQKRLLDFQSASESMYFPSTSQWKQNLDHAIEESKLHLKELSSKGKSSAKKNLKR